MMENAPLAELERRIARMNQHITQQDAEIFRLTKRLDALLKRLTKLEGRLHEGAVPSPIDPENDVGSEKPPHY